MNRDYSVTLGFVLISIGVNILLWNTDYQCFGAGMFIGLGCAEIFK